MPGQNNSAHSDFAGSRVLACLAVTYHLHFSQNDRGRLRASTINISVMLSEGIPGLKSVGGKNAMMTVGNVSAITKCVWLLVTHPLTARVRGPIDVT